MKDSFLWEVPGKEISIHLEFSVLDLLVVEIMRGFGAVPRRGAEVGGILLGRAESSPRRIVYIDDMISVKCEHRRGPSYLLADSDAARWDATMLKHRYTPGKGQYAVGCFRSHTREGDLSMADEDIELFDRCFPEENAVFLLVKPYATKPSIGGFMFRENGGIVSRSSYQEFPFRRKELGGGRGSRPRPRPPDDDPAPATERPVGRHPRPGREDSLFDPPEPQFLEPGQAAEPNGAQPAIPAEETFEDDYLPLPRRSNVWMPMSFVFLAVGGFVGYEAANEFRPPPAPIQVSEVFPVSLTAELSGESLHVRWNPDAPAIRAASRAILTFEEAHYKTDVELDRTQLQNPNLYYKVSTGEVRLTMELLLRDGLTVTEVYRWHREPAK